MKNTTVFATFAAALALAACSSSSTTTPTNGTPSGSSGGPDGGVSGLPGSENGAGGLGTFDRAGFGDTHLAASKDGSIHLAFTDGGSAATWYAHCSANCGDPASWNPVKIAPNPIATGYQSVNGLGEDASGRLHMLLTDFVYATCASGCDSPSSWTFTDLRALESGGYTGTFGSFVVAPSGELSFISTSGNYFTCASDCSNVASWKAVLQIPGTALHLRRDGKGGMHLLTNTSTTAQGEMVLSYAHCASACDDKASWQISQKGFLAKTQAYSPTLTTTASGRVYVAYQQGALANAADPNNGKLVVATCAGASCTDVDTWSSFGFGDAADDGGEGTWVEAADESVLVASAAGNDLLVRTCDTGCDAAAGWSAPTVVDTSDAIAKELPADLVTCGGAAPETSSYEARFPKVAISGKGAVVVHRPRAIVRCPGDANPKSSPPIGRVASSF